MTKQLYEEALADVKKLKEVAEDNAKRALLEAVTPRIRDLIENQLLGENAMEDEVRDEDKLLLDDEPMVSEVPSEDFEEMPLSVSPEMGSSAASAEAISMPDEEGKLTLDLDALKTPTGEYELNQEAAMALGSLINSSKSTQLRFESSLRKLVDDVNRLAAASKIIKESSSYGSTVKTMVDETKSLYKQLQESMSDVPGKKKYENVLNRCYSTLNKLTEQNMKRNRSKSLLEGDVTLKLTGMPDDLDLDSIGVDLITGGEEEGDEGGDEDLDLGDEEGGEEESGDEDEDLDLSDLSDEGEESSDESGDSEEKKMESRRLSNDTIVEIDEGMLRREIARMKALREADETKAQSWGNGPGEVSDEFADDDMGDPFVDIELTTEADADKKSDKKQDESDDLDEDDMDEVDEMSMHQYGMDEDDDTKAKAHEADMDEADMDEADMDEADMDEADMDEAEDVRQMGGNVASQGTGPGAATNKQGRQPGATVEGLRRRLAAEYRLQTEAKKKAQQAKKMQEKQQAKKQAKKMQEAYNFFATKFNESVARSSKLRGMLAEASSRKGSVLNGAAKRSAVETSNLRAKLAETNLFNAKLLFTNKLLQNESLTKRQKAEVIERLDEARTEREVKLVYESVTRSLSAAAPRNLTESASPSVIGSASRPTRSATNNINEGFEADRWARLAGIVK